MTRTALLPLAVFKEVRALAVPWLACLAAMVAPVVVDVPRALGGISVLAYFLGAAALGALSIGHEYTGRTLGLLLSLPARRRRLLLIKLGVLAAMLLVLWVVADTLVFRGPRESQAENLAASVLAVLCALFLAPWLTMACRNPIAGTVFTMAIPGVLLTVGELIGAATYGRGPETDALRMAILWWGTLGLCAIGASASWRMFMRLEAIDGRDPDVRLPQWLQWPAPASTAASSFRKRNPMWLLVKKELRLQQMTLVVAGLYVFAWLVIASASSKAFVPHVDDALTILTFFYVGLVALLIGSLASAGERQLRTLEWQVLLPPGTSLQWALKMGVVLGLAMLLAIGLPAVSASIYSATNPLQFLRPELAVIIVLLTAGSLYVSSLCNSGLWALLMSMTATCGTVTLVGVAIAQVTVARVESLRVAGGMAPRDYGPRPLVLTPLLALFIAGLIAVLLRFAFTNHRSAEPAASRVWKQAILMAVFAATGVMILTSRL